MPRIRSASTSLFSLGGTGHGAIDNCSSMRANHGSSSASPKPFSPCASRQKASVRGGVRKLEVQLTVVEPPTERPCMMVTPLSFVRRPADSW